MKRCTKAIIPVAGYGTRRMPLTKAIEKCMIPLGNRPVIDYIVADCVKAGITDIYFVVSGEARQLRDYYAKNDNLEHYLKSTGKSALIPRVQPPQGVNFHFVTQNLNDGLYGTTIPVWLCRDYIDDDELMLVVMGDDVTYSPHGESDIERLVDVGEPAILGVPVPDGSLESYGVIAQDDDGVFQRIVEKPVAGTEPSRMINVSKYILPGTFMDFAHRSVLAGSNENGEYFITDPINALVESGTALRVVEARGKYMDTGTVANWIEANNWLLKNDYDNL